MRTSAGRARSHTVGLVVAALLAAAVGVGAQTKPVLHAIRKQACPKDADNRCRARSAGGHFSVSLPVPFNEESILGADEKGRPLHMYVVGSTTPSGIKFSVITFWKPSEPANAATLEKAITALGNGDSLKSHRPMTLAGMQGEHGRLEGKDTSADIYVAVGNNALYQLIVEFPKAAAAEAAREIPRLLASFKTHGSPDPIETPAH
jgi:hypothetical protein